MAEGWVKHFMAEQQRDDIRVFSAGSSPLGHIPTETIQCMAEVDVDISDQSSKAIADLPQKHFDVVISLCGDRCPFVPGEQHIDWPIDDPYGLDADAYRAAREDIKQRVLQLLQEV